MPRHGRFVVVGHPQHVISRGSNRQAIFCCNKDCSFYLDKASKLQRIQWQIHLFQTGLRSRLNCASKYMILVMQKMKKLFDWGAGIKVKIES